MTRRRKRRDGRPPGTPRTQQPSEATLGIGLDRSMLGFAGLIVVAVLIAYIPAYRAGFIWDDDDYIVLNPLLTEDGEWAEIWDPGSGRNPQFYPLVFTTFRIERSLWGLDPTGYHVVNVLLHAANSVLLLILLRTLNVPGGWVVAGLFAVHPVCVESVAWVTERKNVLSAFFYFLAALSYLRFDHSVRYRWFGVTLACFLLALFAKTVTASLPVALALILWWRGRPFTVRRIATLASMLVVGFGLGMLTRAHEFKHVLGGQSPFADLAFPDRLVIAARAFLFYPMKVLWPANLSFMYTRWDPSKQSSAWLILLLLVVAMVIAAIVLFRRGRIGRGPLAAFAFYAVTIFPALGFVDVAPLRFASVADHFQYLACIGILLLVVGGVAGWVGAAAGTSRRRPRVTAAACIGILLMTGLGAMTYARTGVYRDLGTLWADTVDQSPANWLAQLNYGAWLQEEGRLEEAAARYEQVLLVTRPVSEGALLAQSNLAAVHFRQGEYARSLDRADLALAIKPTHPAALKHRGRALRQLGRLEEAEASLRALLDLQIDPAQDRAAWDIRRRVSDVGTWLLLAEIQAEQGRIDDAAISYRNAIDAEPSRRETQRRRLLALTQWRRYADAVDAAEEAITLFPDETSFQLQLAWLLATSPDDALRNGDRALTLAENAVQRSGDANPLVLSVKAAAEAEVGRISDAAATARAGLAIAEQSQQSRFKMLVPRLRIQLMAYDQGKRYYEMPPPG